MDSHNQQAIDGLFQRLAEAERGAPPRDDEAEAFIRDRIASQPAAPYFMAQTILVMEQALREAQERVEALEAKAERPRGFLGGLFGEDAPAPRAPAGMPRVPHRGAGGQSGGFLAGAAQTAVGVAGGVLLGSAVAGLFAADPAEAAAPEESQEDPAADTGADGDFGDFEL